MTTPSAPIPYRNDVETIPHDEDEDIRSVIQILKSILTRSKAKTGESRADVHVKTHGYGEAEFRVLPNLPDELAQGLFEHEGVYPAVVRFSNAASQDQSDAIPDGRGLSLKVLNVKGEVLLADTRSGATQDFLMINHPVFFARTVKDYLRLEQIILDADDNPLVTLQQGLTAGDWNPLHWHWRQMLTAASIAGQLPSHPANNTYYSMSPIRFGNYVVKYRVKPVGDDQSSYLELLKQLAQESNAMRLALEESLRTHEVRFDFQVQLRTCDQTMPIEDPTIAWPECESPFRTVAHLVLPRQEIALLRQQEAYINLSFNVWHALAAHRPLGGINRVRRYAYEVSADWRRQKPTSNSVE